jgi:diguanylate cyclase (GGDEF)-like protein
MGDGGLQVDVRALLRRPLLLSLLVLGVVELVRFALDPRPLDVAVLLLVGVVGLAATRERDRAVDTEGSRRTEAESFSRILSGLSRSVSPDAIVDAIVEELGIATGADHVAVVRRRPETHNLEAILSPTRAGAPASRTSLPLRDLEDPALEQAAADLAIAAARGRRLTAVPIEPDPDGDPGLVPLGIGGRAMTGGMGRGGDPSLGRDTGRDRRGVGAPDGPALALAAGGAAVATMAPPVRRAPQATPARDGADQRIADHLAGRLRDTYGLRNLLAAPLRVNGRVEGAIVLSRRVSTAWPGSTHRFLEAAAVEVSAALARVYSLRAAEARATTDALTGLPNRRYFDEYLGLLAQRRRADDRVGVLMIDIDRFKRLNDTFGHAVGDHVLREVAQAIAHAVREDDVPARFGGEEFAVLLKNPSGPVAVEVGERVRRAVARLDLRHMGVPGVSVSVGVAVASEPDVALDAVVDEADRALYRAKRAGRDRVVAA